MAHNATKVAVPSGREANDGFPVPRAWPPYEALLHEMDRFFDDIGRGPSRFGSRLPFLDADPARARDRLFAAGPAVDVVERGDVYTVTAELPGLQQTDIQISTTPGLLRIKGEKKQDYEEQRDSLFVAERRYGAFERVLSLPEGVDTDRIEAVMDKGVLTVTLPKSAAARAQVRTVPVKSA